MSNVIFEEKCSELGIDYDIETIVKKDPKIGVIWECDVAFPNSVAGFVALLSEEACLSMLVDKTSITLRAQNDPRRAKGIEIDGMTYTKAELIELGKQAAREKMNK